MQKILILEEGEYAAKWRHDGRACILETYKNKLLSTKILRRIDLTVAYTLNKAITSNEFMYDTIVVQDYIATKALLKWLKRKKKASRYILLLCNRKELINNFSIKSAQKIGYEVWSYSSDDCQDYGYNYFRQFFNKDYITSFSSKLNNYDAVFVGENKGREKTILKIYEELRTMDYRLWFYVLGIDSLKDNRCIDNCKISYEEYLKTASESSSIVEIVTDSNRGITWRAVEALFLEKKLITNNKDIIKEPFYNSNNVYIYGEEKRNIKEFMDSDYIKIGDEIKELYDVDGFFESVLGIGKDN